MVTKHPLSNDDFVQIDAKIYLTATATEVAQLKANAAGQSVAIYVNGTKAVAVNVDKDGKIPTGENTPSFGLPNKYTSGSALTITTKVEPAVAKIFVDGAELTAAMLHDNVYSVENMKDYYLAWQNADGEWVGIVKAFTAADGTGVALLDPAKLTAAAATGDGVTVDAKGEIHLVRAWAVDGIQNATHASATWKTYSSWRTSDPLSVSKAIQASATPTGTVDKAYYPANVSGQYIWLQATKAGVIWVAKDGTKLEKVVDVTAVDDTDATGAKALGVWRVPVTGNITSDSFVALVTLGNAEDRAIEIANDTVIEAGYASDWLTVEGIVLDKNYGNNVSIDIQNWKSETAYKGVTVAGKQIVNDDNADPTKKQFEIKLLFPGGLSASDKGQTIGTLTLTITAPDGNKVETPVAITMGA